MESILIVEDDSGIRKQLKWGLDKKYKVLLAEDGKQALAMFAKQEPKVVTLDLGLPPDTDGASEGLRVLEEILAQGKNTKVIVVSGNEEHKNALMAINLGAYDFCHKPVELDTLKVILERAFHLYNLEDQNRRLQSDRVSADSGAMQGIFSQCPEMEEIFAIIRKVGSIDVPVLVLGESGTGKELVARAIHENSLRKDGPFIPINCGAIPENLLEAELFGHEKGSFTGAQARVQGKVEFAHGGTLFLDEIGDMPLLLQVKLLRFLQEKVIQRVGGREDIQVDARIVAATNIDIEEATQNGTFREDLYYRIGVVTINLPPLKERGDDIALLANLFMRRFANEFKQRVRCFSVAALRALNGHDWPGNIRELENRVKRAVVMAESQTIEPRDLGFPEDPTVEEEEAKTVSSGLEISGLKLKEARSLVEKRLLAEVLDETYGNVLKAAEALGVSRPTLYDLMKKHNYYVDDKGR
ncbi:MAG TPA: PEP-CTERM-box response regulator transcription factor [Desulfuromonadales bacterium]|nr:PEP-CTERM-box response regulator transcription factor [Desulfuromonadales bacterium]